MSREKRSHLHERSIADTTSLTTLLNAGEKSVHLLTLLLSLFGDAKGVIPGKGLTFPRTGESNTQ